MLLLPCCIAFATPASRWTAHTSSSRRSPPHQSRALAPRRLTAAETLPALRGGASGSAVAAKPPQIIIAGAPASGKGTQCENIARKYGVVHLSTGDILRAAVAGGTPVGQAAQKCAPRTRDEAVGSYSSWFETPRSLRTTPIPRPL